MKSYSVWLGGKCSFFATLAAFCSEFWQPYLKSRSINKRFTPATLKAQRTQRGEGIHHLFSLIDTDPEKKIECCGILIFGYKNENSATMLRRNWKQYDKATLEAPVAVCGAPLP